MPEFPYRIPPELRTLPAADFDALPFGALVLDALGRVLRVNDPEAQRTERDPADFVGRDFFLEIAPCLEIQGHARRFRQGATRGSIEEVFAFIYPRRVGNVTQPEEVIVTLLSVEPGFGYVLATTRPLGA